MNTYYDRPRGLKWGLDPGWITGRRKRALSNDKKTQCQRRRRNSGDCDWRKEKHARPRECKESISKRATARQGRGEEKAACLGP